MGVEQETTFMRIVSDLMLFFICFNCACGMLVAMNDPNIVNPVVFGFPVGMQPQTSPGNMHYGDTVATILGNFSITTGISQAITGILAGISVLAGSYLIGAGLITLLALSFFAPTILSIFNGFPVLLNQLITDPAVRTIVVIPLVAIFGFIFSVFLIEYIGGRDIS